MPAGFMALRSEFPMNVRRKVTTVKPSEAALADIKRLGDIWAYALDNYGGDGPFLFGQFSIADALYAPVVTRLDTYGLKVPAQIEAYIQVILNLGPMKDWYASAQNETWVIERVEL
jgi:glutathione S-transferase